MCGDASARCRPEVPRCALARTASVSPGNAWRAAHNLGGAVALAWSAAVWTAESGQEAPTFST